MSISNAAILNAIRQESNEEYQNVIPLANGAGSNILGIFAQYPTAKNMFINDLVNKVAMSKIYNEGWSNPLRIFFKGKLPFGQTIEQLFVGEAERKAFNEHFTGSTSDEGDVMGKVVNKVHANYISVNMMNKYKVSISEDQLKLAFFNEFGLSNLVSWIINSVYEQAEIDDYEYSKACIYNMIASVASNADTTKNQMFLDLGGELSETTAKKFLTITRGIAGRLRFMSKKYNAAGVRTSSKRENLVALLTPEAAASVDVNALASLFNLDKAEMKYRLVEVDELPIFTTEYVAPMANAMVDPSTGKYADIVKYEIATHLQNIAIDAIIVDESAFQMYETLNTTRTFENPNSLTTNIFLHRQGIAGANPYANFIVIYHEIQ